MDLLSAIRSRRPDVVLDVLFMQGPTSVDAEAVRAAAQYGSDDIWKMVWAAGGRDVAWHGEDMSPLAAILGLGERRPMVGLVMDTLQRAGEVFPPLHVAAVASDDGGAMRAALAAIQHLPPKQRAALVDEQLEEMHDFARPLMLACAANNIGAVAALLAAGSAPDEEELSWCSPLIVAAQNNNADIATSLLRAGADPRWQCAECCDALFRAAERGSLDVMRVLQAAGVPWTQVYSGNETLLHALFDENGRCVDVVGPLVQAGVNVNAVDNNHDSALCMAVARGHSDLVHALLAHGADPMLPSPSKGRHSVSETLVHRVAAMNCDDDVFGQLMRTPVPADVALEGGWTPLMAASEGCCLDTVALLLAAGADVHRRMDHPPERAGWGCLHFAAHRGGSHVVSALLNAGADPLAITSGGHLPLHLVRTLPPWAQAIRAARFPTAAAEVDDGYVGRAGGDTADGDMALQSLWLLARAGAWARRRAAVVMSAGGWQWGAHRGHGRAGSGDAAGIPGSGKRRRAPGDFAAAADGEWDGDGEGEGEGEGEDSEPPAKRRERGWEGEDGDC
jgi:ankyrin repeat protein